ncbi:unnamed protein product [Phaeothamnion confervicola]
MILSSDMLEISDAEYRKLASKPLVKSADMSADQVGEALEVVTMSVDKFVATKNYEAAAAMIANTMDKKFGSSWHCAIGEGFGFDVTYQRFSMVYVFYGQIGILVYKS